MKPFSDGQDRNSDCTFSTPIFDGATIAQINEYTEMASFPNMERPIFMMAEPVNDSISLQLLV